MYRHRHMCTWAGEEQVCNVYVKAYHSEMRAPRDTAMNAKRIHYAVPRAIHVSVPGSIVLFWVLA